MIKLNCKNCNKDFKVIPFYKNKRKFCSQKCHNENNRISRTCLVCKKIFIVPKFRLKPKPNSKLKEGALYCSSKCHLKRPQTGINNPQWKGGITYSHGYIKIKQPEHPYADKIHKYVLQHRLVMEKSIGRYLKPNELVHHRNGIRNDNRIENLQIVHPKTHYGEICCPKCQFKFVLK